MAQEVCPPGGARWTDGRCVPEGLIVPPATWVLDDAIPSFAAVMVAVMVIDAVRKRRLTWWLLISICSAMTWWMETFGDWAQHLSYSPEFRHYTLTWKWSAPHNPMWMPMMYAAYWVAHAWAILRIAQWAGRRWGWSLEKAMLVLTIPVTWIWNFVIEGGAAYMGWWSYDPGIGPTIDMGRGNWPLLWPMTLMFGWINLIAYVVGFPEDDDRLNRLERFFRLDRLLARDRYRRAGASIGLDPSHGNVRFQLLRFGAWSAFFQVTFLLTLVVPLHLMRHLTGWAGDFLP
jgi:hypothetical protein